MNKKLLFVLVLVAVLSVVFVGGKTLPKGVASADSTSSHHTIFVTGEGKVEVKPDISILSFGVSVDDKDPQKAMDGLTLKANAVVKALFDLGIPEEKIQTSNLSLYPVYSYDPQTGKATLEGYRASESFSVETAIAKAGKTLSAVVKAGVTDIGGITFDASTKEDLKLQAIQAAMKNARAKADATLKDTSYKVTAIESISVDTINYPQPILYKAVSNAADSVPVQGGTLDITVNVTVVFNFD
jgi:uncharacterized protein YggE